MPITINEVEIITNVNESASNSPSGGASSGPMSAVDKEILIQECLARVKELLEDLKER